jgi:hypothetical protein
MQLKSKQDQAEKNTNRRDQVLTPSSQRRQAGRDEHCATAENGVRGGPAAAKRKQIDGPNHAGLRRQRTKTE